jgi:hypothetical protein
MARLGMLTTDELNGLIDDGFVDRHGDHGVPQCIQGHWAGGWALGFISQREISAAQRASL